MLKVSHIKHGVRVLTSSAGRGPLKVLSAISTGQVERQKDIVEKTSLSKGAVSNGIRKLRSKGLVTEDELRLNEDELVSLYREHLETFLIRESSEPSELNDLRTFLKKNVDEVVGRQEVSEALTAILVQARERPDLESLNSVFKETDRFFRETGEDDLRLIGLATDKSSKITENSEISEEAKKVLDEAQKDG